MGEGRSNDLTVVGSNNLPRMEGSEAEMGIGKSKLMEDFKYISKRHGKNQHFWIVDSTEKFL